MVKLAAAGVTVLLIGGGAYLVAGTSRDAAGHGSSEVAKAAVQSFDIILTANGDLAAKKQTELRNTLEMEASITEVVDEGKFVRKDEVLLRLNDEEIQKQKDAEMLEYTGSVSEAVSAEKSYEIQVIENEAAYKKAELTLELAELDLRKWEQGENKAKLEELELALQAAEKDYERVKEKYEKARVLLEREFLSKDQFKQDEVSLIEAESKLKTARTNLMVHRDYTQVKERRKLESERDEAVAELERVKRKNESELSSKEAARDRARAEKAQRERQLAKIERQLEACVIKAPTDGLVVYGTSVKPDWYFDGSGPIAIGRKVRPNETVIVLPDTTEMRAQIKIHESLVSKVKPGQKAVVRIDAAQGRAFEGTVESIGIMAQSGGWSDPNLREYEVKISLRVPPDAPPLKPSMRCEAQVTTERVEDVLAVPLAAVFNEGTENVVYAVRGGKYEKLPVTVGRRSDMFAELTGGLKPGEQVLLREPLPALVINRNAPKASEGPGAKPVRPGDPAQARSRHADAAPAAVPVALGDAPQGDHAESADNSDDEPQGEADEADQTDESGDGGTIQ